MQDFNGKVAIVTGAADGIGETVAETLYARGASVVIASRNADKTMEKAKALDPSGKRSLGLACDVSVPEQVSELITVAVGYFGGLHCAVNNAGIVGPATRRSQTPALKTGTPSSRFPSAGCFIA